MTRRNHLNLIRAPLAAALVLLVALPATSLAAEGTTKTADDLRSIADLLRRPATSRIDVEEVREGLAALALAYEQTHDRPLVERDGGAADNGPCSCNSCSAGDEGHCGYCQSPGCTCNGLLCQCTCGACQNTAADCTDHCWWIFCETHPVGECSLSSCTSGGAICPGEEPCAHGTAWPLEPWYAEKIAAMSERSAQQDGVAEGRFRLIDEAMFSVSAASTDGEREEIIRTWIGHINAYDAWAVAAGYTVEIDVGTFLTRTTSEAVVNEG